MYLLNPTFDTITSIIGLITLSIISLSILSYIFRLFRRTCPTNLLKKYGQGSWAVITGGSDGIGRAFAEQLAKRGFNLVLVARNQSKLEKVASEIEMMNNKISIKIVTADFSKSWENDFFEKIYEEIKELNVSMLINNVGIGGDKMGLLHEYSEAELKDMVYVNVMPTILLTRKFINHFRARQERSAIIQVSSTVGIVPMPYTATYGCTKTLEDYFSRALQLEYPDIDMLSLRPGFVSTNMTYHRDSWLDTITSVECAEGALRELGRYERTLSHIKHEFLVFLMSFVPSVIYNFVLKTCLIPPELKRREVARSKLQEKA